MKWRLSWVEVEIKLGVELELGNYSLSSDRCGAAIPIVMDTSRSMKMIINFTYNIQTVSNQLIIINKHFESFQKLLKSSFVSERFKIYVFTSMNMQNKNASIKR